MLFTNMLMFVFLVLEVQCDTGTGVGFRVVKAQSTIATPTPAFMNKTWPVWLWAVQDPGDHITKWNRNYSMQWDFRGHGCYPNTQQLLGFQQPGLGRLLMFFNFHSTCSEAERTVNNRGLFDILLAGNPSISMDKLGLAYSTYTPHVDDPAVMTFGLPTYSDIVTVSDSVNYYFDKELDFSSESFLLNGGNLTLHMGTPHTIYGGRRAITKSGTFESFCMYGGVTTGLLLMLTASIKYIQFYNLDGKFRANLPQLQLSTLFMMGFATWFSSSFNTYVGSISGDLYEFFYSFAWVFSYTSILMMGLYFREVATLTSAQTQNTLSRLKIPALLLIAIVWLFFLVVEILRLVDPEPFIGLLLENLFNRNTADGFAFQRMSQATVAFVYIVVLLDCTILVFGCLSLFLSMKGVAGASRTIIIRIIVLTGVVVCAHLSLGLASFSRLLPSEIDMCQQCTASSRGTLFDLLLPWLHHLIVGMALLLNFRVEVHKNVELSARVDAPSFGGGFSRSGETSSTYSGSSSQSIGVELTEL